MPDQIEISSLRNEEIPALVRLVNSAYRGESSKKGWTTEADLLDGIRTKKALDKDLENTLKSVLDSFSSTFA